MNILQHLEMKILLCVVFLFGELASLTRPEVSQVQDSGVFRNCWNLHQEGSVKNGIYTIYPYEEYPDYAVEVYCDMTTDGGGWTVIQRRDDILPRENFYRTWREYELGFGNLLGEFWLSLNHIHAITNQTHNQIRFDLANFENEARYAKYDTFYVHEKSQFYKMEVSGYTGDAGDSFRVQNGQFFSALDKDLDNDNYSCAITFKGGWWYNQCHACNLNGLYLSGHHDSYADGIEWSTWMGFQYSLKFTEMKIRPLTSTKWT